MKTLSMTLAATLLLAACAGAPLRPPGDLPVPPAAFKEAAPATAATPPRAAWWETFGDPLLDDLAQRAALHNRSLQVAAARLAQARALLARTEAERRPQVQLTAGAGRESTPATQGRASTSLGLGASLAWEVDVAGRLARGGDAAALDAREREALLNDARLLVQAEVARSYFALRALDAERVLVRATVQSHRDTLQLTERRLAAGDVPELEVARVRTELTTNEAEALALDRQRSQLEHALAVLVGEAASDFAIAEGGTAATLPQVPAGVPSTVLVRRPDIAATRHALLAAQARLGIAETAWWPALALTANGGLASPELGDLLRAGARSWGLSALLSLPVFDGGRREAGIAAAQAEMAAALARHRDQALIAFREVEDELAAVRLLGDQAAAQARAVDAAARVSALSMARYRNGYVSQFELLEAQRGELRSRRQQAQVSAARFQATVGLIRALGGSWSE